MSKRKHRAATNPSVPCIVIMMTRMDGLGGTYPSPLTVTLTLSPSLLLSPTLVTLMVGMSSSLSLSRQKQFGWIVILTVVWRKVPGT